METSVKLPSEGQRRSRPTGRGYPARYWCQNPYHPTESAYITPFVNCICGGRDLTEEERQTSPKVLNAREGLNRGQEAAMRFVYLNAVEDEIWDWNHPRANPMNYNAAGEYLGG